MIVIYLLLAFLAAVCIGGICYIVYRLEELDEIKEELDKYSVHLDERANKIAAAEDALTIEWKSLRAAEEKLGRAVK